MWNNHPYFPGNPMPPLVDQTCHYTQNRGLFPSTMHPSAPPFHNVNIQPSVSCPRNFIIFDQTNNQSQIMFHPEMNPKFVHSHFGFAKPFSQNENIALGNDPNDESKISSHSKEDSDDIDALLMSTEYEDENDGDSDDEVMSTARTGGVYACNSPDSCSNYGSPSRKRRALFFRKSRESDKKRQRMRKMVKALRGIVPGANGMSTVGVLDEAVSYLKSLRVQVQKLN